MIFWGYQCIGGLGKNPSHPPAFFSINANFHWGAVFKTNKS